MDCLASRGTLHLRVNRECQRCPTRGLARLFSRLLELLRLRLLRANERAEAEQPQRLPISVRRRRKCKVTEEALATLCASRSLQASEAFASATAAKGESRGVVQHEHVRLGTPLTSGCVVRLENGLHRHATVAEEAVHPLELAVGACRSWKAIARCLGDRASNSQQSLPQTLITKPCVCKLRIELGHLRRSHAVRRSCASTKRKEIVWDPEHARQRATRAFPS